MSQGGNSNHTTVVLVGSEQERISNQIIDNPGLITTLGKCRQIENERFTVITTPDLSDKETPDQNVIDCMALCHPGPHVFLLLVQDREATAEGIGKGIGKIQEMYGEEIARKTDVLILNSFQQQVKVKLPLHIIYSENGLEKRKEKWSNGNSKPLEFNFNLENAVKGRRGQKKTNNCNMRRHPNEAGQSQDIPEDVVMEEQSSFSTRKNYGWEAGQKKIKKSQSFTMTRPITRSDSSSGRQQSHAVQTARQQSHAVQTARQQSHAVQTARQQVYPVSPPENTLNMVLLGLSGTGKSACGNTILRKKAFPSRASSIPVTRECKAVPFETYGTKVTIIDTPDFFDENIKGEHVYKCRELCQTGACVYLLVMQVGRFTDGERGILEKLETAFESKIRERTIVLFTHGENLRRSRMTGDQFVKEAEPHLQEIVQLCGGRYHVFKDKSKDQLLKKICSMPENQHLFPNRNSGSGSNSCTIS
ncbi:uncharacterized protein LOC134037517 [Osmerus eperlanus]|uniref:uncharacterized protein LOC134037517 n=1 Tax=Osmerus eperlanus TaxID=29151 RepID=UPI002E115BFD